MYNVELDLFLKRLPLIWSLYMYSVGFYWNTYGFDWPLHYSFSSGESKRVLSAIKESSRYNSFAFTARSNSQLKPYNEMLTETEILEDF